MLATGHTTTIFKGKKKRKQDASISPYLKDTQTRNQISPTLTKMAKNLSV